MPDLRGAADTKLKPRKPIAKISKKRLEREFGGKIPYNTVGRSFSGRTSDFESANRGSIPRRPAIKKISAKQAARQLVLNQIRHSWWNQGKRECGICHKEIKQFDDYVIDHIRPRGMGGGKRDDSETNLQPAHFWCNSKKGSRREKSLDILNPE